MGEIANTGALDAIIWNDTLSLDKVVFNETTVWKKKSGLYIVKDGILDTPYEITYNYSYGEVNRASSTSTSATSFYLISDSVEGEVNSEHESQFNVRHPDNSVANVKIDISKYSMLYMEYSLYNYSNSNTVYPLSDSKMYITTDVTGYNTRKSGMFETGEHNVLSISLDENDKTLNSLKFLHHFEVVYHGNCLFAIHNLWLE